MKEPNQNSGLFFVFGPAAELACLHWRLNRRFGWRSRVNQPRRRNEPGVVLHTHQQDMTWWLMPGWLAGGPLKK